jgi:hypothetical protein
VALGDSILPHRRSQLSLQKRFIRGIIFSHAYYDRLHGEVVSLLSRGDILNMLNIEGSFSLWLVPDVERGEVLVDSRGGGSFQKPIHTPSKA